MAGSLVIIGIHGLANKPEAETLEGWWKDSILEGLERNQGRTSRMLSFESVYWADVLYAEPISADENKEEPLSDERLLEFLRDQGIEIARRTVAKYRKELGLGSSWQRRRHSSR